MSKVDLETFAGGALQEKFDDAMEKILQNMMDPNTPWKNKRKIIVEVTFEQNEDRDDAVIDVSVVPKLTAAKPISTKMAIGKDIETGECYTQEYGKTIRGQINMEDYQRQQEMEMDGKIVDTVTGEIKEPEKVVDFRTVKQA